MTTQEVKEFLRGIRDNQREINHLREMIRQAETNLLPRAIIYDKDKVQISPDEKFSEICAKIADYEFVLGKSIARLLGRKMQAETMIRELPDEKEREVLRWYYLSSDGNEPLTWQQVAIRMNYYERHVKRIHGEALISMAKASEDFEIKINGTK